MKSKKYDFAMIYCIYEEFKPETYNGFKVNFNGEEFVSNTGNPTKDYKKALKLFFKKYPKIQVGVSSNVDNYLMDSDDDKLKKAVYGET